MGLKVQTMSHSFVLLNVCLCCDDAYLISLHEFQTNLQDILNFINDEPYDDIRMIGDLNSVPFKKKNFQYFLKSSVRPFSEFN